MSVIQVECWNCGQNLRINADKLATARCGGCQQMLVKQSETETARATVDYQTAARTPQSKKGLSRIATFFLYLGGSIFGAFLAIFVLYFVTTQFGIVGWFILFIVVVPLGKLIFEMIEGAAKAANKDRE